MDDGRLAMTVRILRGRRGWRQEDLATEARVTRDDVSLVERGRAAEVRLGHVRAIVVALGGWLDVTPRLAGGDLARTLNAGHARMHETIRVVLRRTPGWTMAHEVSFSIYGERGIIDVLAWHAARRTLLVVELKTSIVDVNELVGTMDRRRRLAPQIARERGWDPHVVGSWVAVADTRTNRRRLAAHVGLLRSAFPADGRQMRSWLREPVEPVAALSFLPSAAISGTRAGLVAPRRVRPVRPRSANPPRGVPGGQKPA